MILSGCAAALLLRSEMLCDIGLFEEDFFLGYEDVDLTYRASVMGWKGIYCSGSTVIHRLNAAIEKIRDAAYYTRSQRNALLAYLYNTPLAVIIVNLPWIAFKYAGLTLTDIFLRRWWMIGTYWRALAQVIRRRADVVRMRRKLLKRRRLSAWAIWKAQRSCIPAYWRLLKEYRRLFSRDQGEGAPPNAAD